MLPDRSTTLLLAFGLGLVPSLALADRKAADDCAAALPAESQAIYADSIVQNPTQETGRAIVTAVTEKLVSEGKLGMLKARPAAEAAGRCLELLRR
jgi:hypothetical protein